MSKSRVTLTVKNNIGYVALNRPDKHNALDFEMFLAIDKVIKKVRKDKSIRVVILCGTGESFCSGLDVKSILTKSSSALRLLFKWLPGNANLAQRVTIGWRRLNVPVIAVLHGKCWGGGMQIALGADFRIASRDCSLAIMESRWGLIPDMGGTLALYECVRGDNAMQLAMTSEVIDASRAQSLGLVTHVDDEPLNAAEALAEKLLNRSPDAIRIIKGMYHKIWCSKGRKILAKESLNQVKILLGKNQRIAVKRETGKPETPYHY